jgi:general stress protein 26
VIGRTLAAALLIALALPAPVSAQAAPNRATILAAAKDIMKTARYATLVTVDSAGRPQARIVDPFEPETDWTIWVGTNVHTRKVAQVKADGRVTLLYFDAAAQEFVTVLGTAEVITSIAERARFWKQEWAAFYKDGSNDDNYVLIRVRPTRMEVVSPGRGILNDPKTWLPTFVDIP